MRLKHSVSI
jgi:hypothetical protein